MVKHYSYLAGFALVVAGLARFTLTLVWDPWALGLGAAGVAIVAGSAAWNWREVRVWFADPRGIFAVTTALTTILLVGSLGLINVIAWYRPAEMDLTVSKRNTIAATSRNVLARLERDVVLRQFGSSGDPAVDQLLRAFAGAGPRVSLEFVDVDRDPQSAREFGVHVRGTVIVLSGSTFRKVETPTEQALVTAALQVTEDAQYAVCFVSGHGERGVGDGGSTGLSRLVSALEAANYRFETVALIRDGDLEDCSAVVLAGPTRDLGPSEIDRLEHFMNRGGRLAVLLDPTPTPDLAAWVETFGIVPDEGVVVDESGAGRMVGGGPTSPLAMRYNDHPVVRGFGLSTVYGEARPLTVLEHADRGGRPVAVAMTGARSFVETTPADGFSFDQGRDLRGEATLVAATEIKVNQPAPHPPAIGRLFVVGDADFASNALLSRQGNRDFFLRALSWLVGESEAVIVDVPEPENRRIDLTERTRLWMYVVNVGILPLLPLIAGIVVFVRSRR